MANTKYDVVVIGSGPGGYTCAIRCAQLGMKTAIVEKYPTLGGTCLNVGCIPSKALLDSSERYHQTIHGHEIHGINVGKIDLNFSQMVKRTRSVVSKTSEGISYLMKKNKIDQFEGVGSFVDPHRLHIEGKDSLTIESENFIIATGSKPTEFKGAAVDKQRIITSTQALYLPEVPKHLLVIGAGVIGLELGSVYARLGSEVSVVEYADSPLSNMDADIAREATKILKKQGLKFYTGHGVDSVTRNKNEVFLKATSKNNQGKLELKGDYCLVAIGRRSYTQGLGLEKLGIELNQRGQIPVNKALQSVIPNIFAIGDVIEGAMLAHKAEEEGVFVAESLAGQKPHINYNLIPGIVYTWPEIASVGQTEEELKAASIPYKKGKFPFMALGRARASEEADGFVKVLAHKDSDELLGVHMIGPRVADLINEAVVAMEFRASAEDIGRSCHGHPTYSEAFKEACLDASEKRAINI